jgi:starch-binding outer membrane protein, SusD/RagB family
LTSTSNSKKGLKMKMKKILLPLCLVAVLGSCKKVIEVPETDLLAGETALSTVGYVEQAVLGAYAVVTPAMDILLNATFSDEVAKSEFYNSSTTHEWTYGPADVTLRDNFTAIGPNYTIINRVNVALEALPKADSTAPGDEVKRNRLKGEALFLRAFAHFELFRYYSGNYDPNGLAMAYMEASTIENTARIKMGEYFQKLNADLAQAKTLVVNSVANINRANFAAVAGLQARVALYMRDWANAETYATEYINALPLATRTEFPGIWTDANVKEQAWRIVGLRLGSLFRATGAQIGTITWKPSEKIWTSYDQANDIRFPSYFKDEPLLTAAGRPSRLIWKYTGTAYGTTNENVANGKMMRTAEMVLIRAEARAEQGKVSGANSAESDINLLRSNRILNYTPVTYTSKQQAIDDILLERFRELAYEGHRFWDLKRRSLPVTRLAIDAPSPQGTTLPADNFRFVLPIPLPEITSNPLMVQNPGYF